MDKHIWVMILLAAFYFIGLCANDGNYYELRDNKVIQIIPSIPELTANIKVERVSNPVDVLNMIQMGAYD